MLGANSPLPQVDKPALVVGSGPNASLSEDLVDRSALLTVNASQAGKPSTLTRAPDVTLFGTTVLGLRPANRAAQRALRRLHTHHLVLIRDDSNPLVHNFNLWRSGYRYDRLTILSTEDRYAIIVDLLGEVVGTNAKPSNGIVLALLALHVGAPRVVMTGFSLSKDGHSYNTANHYRGHLDSDRAVLAEIRHRGLPIVTNDPAFAEEGGLALSPR